MKPEDLLLAPELSPEQAHQFLKRYGFKDPETADRNLQLVAEEVDIRLILARMIGGLLEAARQTPDPDSALNYFERFFSALTHPANFLGFLSETPEALEALTLICGTSPFSAEILVRNPEYFYWLLDQLGTPWTKSSETYALEAGQATSKFEDKESKLHALARFKRREMLRIGARDFLKVADVVGTITELSNLADVVIQSVYEICYQWLTYKLGVPRYIDESGNLKEARFTIMAMGKLGGHELNYSSDIDLIYVYDGEQENTELRPLGAAIEWGAHQSGAVPPGIRSTAITDFFTKLAQSITHELSALTEEGYFYRVDLRLRPEGSAGPVACSLAACRNYYATWGETFERMALIKARPVGGSIELGLEFCSALGNFIYRKFLDFAALEEIQEIKTRIDSKLGSKEKQARHVKLGAGGIREIEFFVQALQLIYGGSNSGLQERNTVQSLEKLRSHRYLSQKEYQELLNAYLFLRDLEHKLQMVYHLQTHELPTEEEELYKCARRMGFRGKSPSETIDRFMRTYETHTSAVRKIFQDLISYKREGTPGMQMKEASLILNKSLSEVESLEILSKPGFEDLKTALHQIVLLRDAPSFAHSPSKMRNLLANLLPLLLETLRQSPDPDTGLSYFERFVSALGTRDSLYMLLNESSTALHRLILVLSSSQFLADFLCRKPEYLDSLLRDDFLLEVKEIELYQFQLQQILKESKDLETRISLLRSFQQEEMFRIQVTDLLNFCERPSVGKQLASLAEACLTAAFEIACFELEKKLGNSFGQWARNHFVILALGKLGGNDLSYNSDLDLVYFHSADE